MIKQLNSILWKEFKNIKRNMKIQMISYTGITVLFCIILFAKSLLLGKEINPTIINNFIQYSLIIIGYMSFLSNIKFWQEKSLKTLESLFATPIPLKILILGKVLAPTIFSVICIGIYYIIFGLLMAFILAINSFNILNLLFPLIISILFNILFGIINAYGMWCASAALAKLLQLISLGLYLLSIIPVFMITAKNNISDFNFAYFFIILSILSIYCLVRCNKEKAITTLYE